MSQYQSRDNLALINKLQLKWEIAEIKVIVLQVAYSLMKDDVYSRNDAVKDLLEVVRLLEIQEKVRDGS